MGIEKVVRPMPTWKDFSSSLTLEMSFPSSFSIRRMGAFIPMLIMRSIMFMGSMFQRSILEKGLMLHGE